MATYKEKADLISIGAYQAGTDPLIDAAIAARGPIDAFLKQGVTEPSSAEHADSTLGQLATLSGSFEAPVVDGVFELPPDQAGMPLHNAIPPLHIPS
jgi:flagellum-specific ATP synthase